jgi:hypothetical protein
MKVKWTPLVDISCDSSQRSWTTGDDIGDFAEHGTLAKHDGKSVIR